MKHIKNRTVITNNRLILVVRDLDTGQIYHQRKRLPKSASPYIHTVAKKYQISKMDAVAYIKKRSSITIKEALKEFNSLL